MAAHNVGVPRIRPTHAAHPKCVMPPGSHADLPSSLHLTEPSASGFAASSVRCGHPLLPRSAPFRVASYRRDSSHVKPPRQSDWQPRRSEHTTERRASGADALATATRPGASSRTPGPASARPPLRRSVGPLATDAVATNRVINQPEIAFAGRDGGALESRMALRVPSPRVRLGVRTMR